MIDIEFYMNTSAFRQYLEMGAVEEPLTDPVKVFDWLEAQRSRRPVVFNIESTNACNMSCPFCPRTTQMTRPVKTMSRDVFARVAEQLDPHPAGLWQKWCEYAAKRYGVPQDEQSENAFFLYVIAQAVTLHGYGDPMLDPHISDYVGMLTARGVPTYFSCNPANIQLWRTQNVMDAGLGWLKYSIDSIKDPARGIDQFDRDFRNIMNVLDEKAKAGYKTKIVVTMIDLGRPEQALEYEGLIKAFEGTGVYLYSKSLDQAWMQGSEPPKSIHWREPCQMPWSSMTIKSDGKAASCQEDFNNEIILGDVMEQSLEEIWNGEAYRLLRRAHLQNTPGLRCTDGRCDMQVIGRMLT